MNRKIFITLGIFLFLSAFILLLVGARLNSQTTDEGIHLFSGYTYLTQKDFRLDSEHPPLLKEIAAAPLLLQKINIYLDERWQEAEGFYFDPWQQARTLSEDFFYQWGNNPEKILFWGRLPFVFLTLALGFLVFWWARKLYGQKAGLLAAFLCLFFPNFLAHGYLINTDIGVTFFIFLSVILWGNFLQKPKFTNLIWAGLALGLVAASKFTGLLVVPILLILWFIYILFYKKKGFWTIYLLAPVGIFIIAYIVVALSYGLTLKAPPTLPADYNQIYLWGNQYLTGTWQKFYDQIRVFLIPSDYFKGLFFVFRHALLGHGSFLLGVTSSTGWWYYFPVVILYKTPIPIFILITLSIIYFRKIKNNQSFNEILLIIPIILFLLFCLFSKANLGVRHIFPIFPFIFVFISKIVNLINFKNLKLIFNNFRKALAPILFILLLTWYLSSALISFPNNLTYFNEFAGGSKNGYKIVVDSNLDWGQDIYRLKKYLTDNNIAKIYIVYPWNGEDSLKYYKINFEPLPYDTTNLHGVVVMSATYLQNGGYDFLMKYTPEQITPGLFIYNLP